VTHALLFDLDGTLVETDPLHHAAFEALLAERGRSLAWEDYIRRVMGEPNATIMARLFPDVPTDQHAALADRKEQAFRDSVREAHPRPGLTALLDWAGAAGWGVAVVTNAPRANAETMLAALGLADRFAALVIGDEVARPKPDPLPYREAMRRLGANPAGCLAFEDSLSGLRAASGSGALTFGLRGALPDAELRAAGAAEVIDDFAAPALWERLRAA
jgi:beta-phosphoglucomutase